LANLTSHWLYPTETLLSVVVRVPVGATSYYYY